MGRVNRDLRTMGDQFPIAHEALPEAAFAHVRRVVAARAADAEDCRRLLDSLGLLDAGGPGPG
ncbi:hypothetical protein GCM10009738_27690 [Kitasatospora viridis]|uniref:Uncharacterized protein n=2 Tax=Kitasatospora viridis TaxID=281105 RepID=A0A561SEF7_9ACTN|nr:hypothetical protein FHX73_16400 [Kitasatospora viridis]